MYQHPVEMMCTCKRGLEAKQSECVLPEGGNWKDIVDVCTAEKRVVSRKYELCATSCEQNERAYAGHCDCDELSVVKQDLSACILKSQCARIQNIEGRDVCLNSDTCPHDLKLSLDNKTCVPYCDTWMYQGEEEEQEKRCVPGCPSDFPMVDDFQQCTTCLLMD